MDEDIEKKPMRKFRVLKGSHSDGKKVYTEGKIVRSDRDLVTLFAGKFVEVGKRDDAEEPVAEKPKKKIINIEQEEEPKELSHKCKRTAAAAEAEAEAEAEEEEEDSRRSSKAKSSSHQRHHNR